MKQTFTLLFLFFSVHIGFSQCDIPGGEMEDFDDITALMEADYGVTLDEPVVMNQQFTPFIRLFLFAFSDLLGDLIGLELEEFIADATGQSAYSPGAEGTPTGLQLTPGAAFNYADAGTLLFACGERPYALSGYYRHVGEATDSAFIVALLDSVPTYEPISSGADISEADVDAYALQVLTGGPDEYTYFEIPIVYNNNEIPDSAIIYLATQGDSLSIAQGNESYFVFDELKFISDPSSVADLDRSNTVVVYPNPTADFLTIQSDEHPMSMIRIYDAFGKLVLVRNSAAQHAMNLEVSSLAPGIYFLETALDEFFARKKFVKQ